jgi:hypothetical protein
MMKKCIIPLKLSTFFNLYLFFGFISLNLQDIIFIYP